MHTTAKQVLLGCHWYELHRSAQVEVKVDHQVGKSCEANISFEATQIHFS